MHWQYLLILSVPLTAFLAVDGAFDLRRERALAESHAVIDAEVVKVRTSRSSRGGCAIREWIEFQPPGRAETFTYHEPWNLFSSSSSIDGLDRSDERCMRSRQAIKIGNLRTVAYVPEDPSLNRPYYGSLSRGSWGEEWKQEWLLSGILAAISMFCGLMWRKQTRELPADVS